MVFGVEATGAQAEGGGRPVDDFLNIAEYRGTLDLPPGTLAAEEPVPLPPHPHLHGTSSNCGQRPEIKLNRQEKRASNI